MHALGHPSAFAFNDSFELGDELFTENVFDKISSIIDLARRGLSVLEQVRLP